MDSQMKKGFLEFCILLIMSKEEVYASNILAFLEEANLIAVEGTLYPLLSRLTKEELVKYRWEESKNGPPRKYYSLTSKGKEKLNNYKQSWSQLNSSINFLISKYE